MHDETTYLSSLSWSELLHVFNINAALRLKLGVKLCPFTGRVEEYTLADQLGGMLNVWPAKWREIIEDSRIEAA
ncbi:hypothetical protein GCM10007989_33680 [Devosia pacifica]|uniref:Uncharacterized protein n=1 Tax=Devosia pacifica TaxID=1335967 RepID=A0A918SC13_9HYPH|nr:hypothetical protein [Devosia pacifica]GHA35024.1 hypothetical protein GCM10007989_33680 [Devosia pacifica]